MRNVIVALLLLPCFALAQNSSGPPGPNGYTIQGTEAFPFISGTAPVGSAQMNDVKNFVGTNFPAGANVSTGVVTPNGGSVTRTLSSITADVINVKSFGAIGDDSHDDTAAINAAFDAARTAIANAATAGAQIVFPYGKYKITSSLNATNLAIYPATKPITIDGGGATIDCVVATNVACLDMFGSTAVTVRDLEIFGTNVGGAVPTTGIQMGRISAAVNADRNVLAKVTVNGLFTLAACYNFASESVLYDHVRCYNSQPSTITGTNYAFILDGLNHFGISSSFVTITAPADTATKMEQTTVVSGDFRNNTGGPTVWLASNTSPRFIGTYVLNLGSNYPVVLYTGIGDIYDAEFDIHSENTTIPAIFFLTGAGNNTPVLNNFRFREGYNFATGSVFVADSNITGVTMANVDIAVNVFNTANLKLWDTPSIYTVTGTIQVPASTNWIAPLSFSGSRMMGSVSNWDMPTTGHIQIADASVFGRIPSDTSTSIALGGNNGSVSTTANNATLGGVNAGAHLTTGNFNSAWGTGALGQTTTASNGAGFGYSACTAVTTGNNNTCLGGNAGATNPTTGVGNILIGANTNTEAAGSNHEINIGGLLYWNNVSTAAPALSSCGTGSPTVDTKGNNRSGTITAGGGTLASCTMTFAGGGYTTWNHCRVTSQSAVASFAYSYTLTTLTVTGTSITSDKFDYDCDGF